MSKGRTWLARASTHQRSIMSARRSGLAGGQVVELGRVHGHVVELPAVLAEGGVPVDAVVVEGPDRLEGDRLPTVVVEGPAPEHLEVLGGPGGRSVRAGRTQQRGEADAVDGRLGHVLDGGGQVDRRPAPAPWGGCRRRGRTGGGHRRRRRCGPASSRCTDRPPRPRGPPASTAGTGCYRPWSTPTGSCCGRRVPRARRCDGPARRCRPDRSSGAGCR